MTKPVLRLEILDSVASTSDWCRSRALAGEGGDVAVLAREQTAGRGTGSRTWRSPRGNLYMSVLLRPRERVDVAAEWSLLASVALAEVLAAHLPGPPLLALKWPNDVLLEGAKCAGILTESSGTPDGWIDFLILGFGVNLAVAPEVPDRPTACLARYAAAPDPIIFAHKLLESLGTWMARRQEGGFAPVRSAWLALGPPAGANLRLRTGSEARDGRFAGLAPDGRLLLATATGTHAFAAGELLAPLSGSV